MPTCNCLTVSFSHVGELSAEAERQGGRVTGTASRATAFSATFGLVCSASITGGVPGYDVLWAYDGVLLTVDNGNLYVVQE